MSKCQWEFWLTKRDFSDKIEKQRKGGGIIGTLYMELYQEFRQKIQEGTLQAGDKLPSKRVLSSQRGVSVNTVDGAYSQLLSQGFIEARAKSGYFVCSIDSVVTLAPPVMAQMPQATKENGVVVDFSTSGVATEKFPYTVWQRMLKQALDTPTSLSRSQRQGDYGLRQQIVSYLYSARGVVATAEQVVVGAGSDRLLSMLAYILPKDWALAVENPVYTQSYRHFQQMGHLVVKAEIDRQGVMVEPLEALEKAVVYTTPSHQFPLGLSMPMGRRVKLLNWAGEHRYIIEDDYDSEFRYDTKPLPALQSIDHNHQVIYMGTFSRSVAPSLRVGYLVLPPQLLAWYHRDYGCFPCEVSTLEQKALALFMAGGHFETHINRMRVHYRNKRQWLLDAIAPLLRDLRTIGEVAGRHLTLQSNRMTEDELCQKALEQGVKVYPISPYFMGACPYDGKVLLGFGGLSKEEIQEGGRRLVKAWGEK